VGASAAGTYSRAKWTASFVNATAAGTVVYTIQLLDAANTVVDTETFTLTVAAADTTAVASKTKIYVNQFDAIATTANGRGLLSDSALVVSANTARAGANSATAVGFIWADFRNASDTNTTTKSGAPSYDVTGSLVLSVSGPGLLSDPDQIGGAGTPAKPVIVIVPGVPSL